MMHSAWSSCCLGLPLSLVLGLDLARMLCKVVDVLCHGPSFHLVAVEAVCHGLLDLPQRLLAPLLSAVLVECPQVDAELILEYEEYRVRLVWVSGVNVTPGKYGMSIAASFCIAMFSSETPTWQPHFRYGPEPAGRPSVKSALLSSLKLGILSASQSGAAASSSFRRGFSSVHVFPKPAGLTLTASFDVP